MSPTKEQHWLIFQQDKLILRKSLSPHPFPNASEIKALKPHFLREHPLFEDDSLRIICAEVAENISIESTFDLLPLRRALESVGETWYTMAAKAYSIIHWDKNHRYCGRCGQQTRHDSDSFERHCPNCSLTFYPRISPSIIVLIEKGDEILMARSAHFMPGVYAFIAGFVEPGETVEDTVHREVMEEVGIKVKNIRYFGSQAWPFPDSLMIAFFAEYESGELTIDPVELEDAGWYKLDALPGRPSSNVSIASKLLNHYLRSKSHGHA